MFTFEFVGGDSPHMWIAENGPDRTVHIEDGDGEVVIIIDKNQRKRWAEMFRAIAQNLDGEDEGQGTSGWKWKRIFFRPAGLLSCVPRLCHGDAIARSCQTPSLRGSIR